MSYFDRNTWFWIFISALCFIPFLGGVHLFDWDEVNFAELAREMVVSGNFLQPQINYEQFTEKPPFFFWLQAICMLIFGVGEFAARFPNAILGVAVLPFLYISGKFLLNRLFGFLWAMSWFGSILPFLYFKSGIIDPWFNFFIFCGLFFLIHFIWKSRKFRDLYLSRSASAYLCLAGIFTGLAVLTKGPVAVLLILLSMGVYWIWMRFQPFISFRSLLQYAMILIGISLLWFGVDIILNGPEFVVEFTIRQWELLSSSDAGHKGFPGYHLVVLLLGCFPASIVALRSFGRMPFAPLHLLDFRRWMVILLAVVILLFSLVGTKIIHYSSMAYYPISFLSAMGLYYLLENRLKTRKTITLLIVIFQVILIVVSAALPYLGMNLEDFRHLFAADPFAYANLEADVDWDIIDFTPAILAFLLLLLFLYLRRRRLLHAYRILFFGNAIWVFTALTFFVGKVESISQRAAVEFFSDKQDEQVYLTTYKYKSYIPWYYGKIKPYRNSRADDQQWLLHGDTDRPVYISAKITARKDLENEISDARFLYEKNGFVFYVRNESGAENSKSLEVYKAQSVSSSLTEYLR